MKLITSMLEKACKFHPESFQYSFSSESRFGFIHMRLASLLFKCWCFTYSSQNFFWRVEREAWYEELDGTTIMFWATANTPACAVNSPVFDWD